MSGVRCNRFNVWINPFKRPCSKKQNDGKLDKKLCDTFFVIKLNWRINNLLHAYVNGMMPLFKLINFLKAPA